MPRPAGPSTRSGGTGRALIALALALALGGCGSTPTAAPDTALPLKPTASRPAFFPLAGLNFSVPQNWQVIAGSAPLVATITSGEAEIAVWRYPRSEPLPRARAALRAARKSLVAAARTRDSTLRLRGSVILRVARAPAVQLLAEETISGHTRLVRSTHVFAHGAELVFDAYAPVSQFAGVDVGVFAPLLASAHVTRPHRPHRP